MLELEYVHTHTCISNAILGWPDSPLQMKDLAKELHERGNKCLIVTEHGYRSNCWQQADEADKYGMSAIVGAEVYFTGDRRNDTDDYHLIMLAKNHHAFEDLNEVLSEGNETGFRYHGRLDWELLERLDPKEFLITTACIGGIFKDRDGLKKAQRLAEMFGPNFYLEVQPHCNEKQILHNQRIIDLHKQYKWPLICGTDTHYLKKEDKYLREEELTAKKMAMPDDGGWDLYLPTADECFKMFASQGVLTAGQIEESFYNTLQVRDWTPFAYDKSRKFPISHPEMSDEQRAKRYEQLIFRGYIDKFGMPNDEEKKELRKEMNTVLETKSYDYFVSSYDMIQEGIRNGGILTKTSRGSAASYATSAALGFTTLNRLHEPVKLYPDRFVSKEKLEKAMPDVDLNQSNPDVFEEAGRTVFGQNGCFPMVAFTKEQIVSAFKMLCRAKSIDPEVANAVSKSLQEYMFARKKAIENREDEAGPDLDKEIDEEVNIDDYIDPQYQDLIDQTKEYQGIIVGISPHPCARLIYHKNLRREIGLISLKGKGKDAPRRLCVFIEGATADDAGYCKEDLNFYGPELSNKFQSTR